MKEMICCQEINEYIDYYEKNKEKFNKERILLMENIVKPTLKRDDIFFDEETYKNCIKYCEMYFYKLFPYQKFIYAFVFMYENDFPVFRTIFIMMGRGNGKDGMIAPLLNFLQSEYYGIKNYNIDIIATSEEQSKDTYDVVYNMLEDNKIKMKKHYYWNKEECISKKTKSKLKYNTSNAKTKDGKKDGALVFNEYHAYEDDKQIKVFKSGAGKVRHFRIFIITTNGDIREGPLDNLLDVCEGVLNGESNELRYFPFICKLDKEEEVDDFEMWEKANPSLPFLPTLQHEMKMDYLEMKKMPSNVPEFMTKRMNLPKQNQELVVTDWENILRASYSDIKKKIERVFPDLENNSAIIGIDLATLNDFAAAGLLFKVNDEYIWRHKTWICKQNKFYGNIKFPFDRAGQKGFTDFYITNEESIDENDIVDWCIQQMQKYNVKKIIMDMYRFKLIKKAFADKGITDIETTKNPNGLIRMIRNLPSVESIIAPKIEIEFIKGNINIGDSAMMRWAINNTCTKNRKDGNKVYEKIEPKLRKNDPFMAFVMAMSGNELLDEQVIYV